MVRQTASQPTHEACSLRIGWLSKLAAAAAVVLLVSGCGQQKDNQSQSSPEAPAAVSSTASTEATAAPAEATAASAEATTETSEATTASAEATTETVATTTSQETKEEIKGLAGSNAEMLQDALRKEDTSATLNIFGQMKLDLPGLLPRTGPQDRQAVQALIKQAGEAQKAVESGKSDWKQQSESVVESLKKLSQ
ncbi:MAG TPA: hypothetical protein VHP11_14615 [Tepidisphaeraceae bacterium]|nr:hypothetical protein [Tepidisphaeraceae bacterium]